MTPSEAPPAETDDDATTMTVGEHLGELRSVLIWSVGFLVGGVVVAAVFARRIFRLLLHPLSGIQAEEMILYTFSPPEVIILYLKITLVGGFVLSSPLLLWKFLGFVLPGLRERERAMILPASLAGGFLFLVGVTFAYLVVLPVALRFLWTFNLAWGLEPHWRINHYVSFVLALCVAFGFSFELPLVVTILARMGLASPAFLRQYRGYVIVGLFSLAALLTPPDVITQLLLALPLWLLYEISIVMAGLVYPAPSAEE